MKNAIVSNTSVMVIPVTIDATTATGERILIELVLPAEATTRYGCPAMATLEIELPDAEPADEVPGDDEEHRDRHTADRDPQQLPGADDDADVVHDHRQDRDTAQSVDGRRPAHERDGARLDGAHRDTEPFRMDRAAPSSITGGPVRSSAVARVRSSRAPRRLALAST